MKNSFFLVLVPLVGACSGAITSNPTSHAAEVVSSSSTSTSSASSTLAPSTSTMPVSTLSPSTTTTAPLPRADLFDDAIYLNVIQAGALDVSVAVMSGGKVVHTYAASSSKSSREVTIDSRFRIASVSKILTAAAIMKLVDGGSVSLDEPIVGQLADELGIVLFDQQSRSITTRQLLSHTSGISNFLKIFFDPGTYDQRRMLTEILGQNLESSPGTTFKYSNVNYVLLGKLIELVTGLSYEAAVHQLILDPLELDSFRLVGTYEFEGLDVLHAVSNQRTYMEQLGAAGAWVANAQDVVKLIDAIDERSPGIKILSEASMKAMTVPSTPQGVTALWDYGLGLRLFVSGEWGHSGSIENIHAMVVKRPDGLAVAILVNGNKPKETDTLIQIINEAVLAARTGVSASMVIPPR